jgi:gluconate 5-dehydrogenase
MRTRELFDLTGRVALVTGASRGLGFALARGLAEAGATVAVNAREETRLAEAVSTLAAEGLRVRPTPFDVTDPAAVAYGVAALERSIGPVDVLVNNAGIQRRGPLEAVTEATWREVLETNLTAPFLVARAVVPGMIARRRGKIVNVTSLADSVARPTIAPYAASKGGLRQLTRAMAVEWARHNVQVNGIGPGYFRTEMNTALVDDPKFDAWVRSRTPAGRWGEPAELVGAAVFLASAASDFVTGQIIYVDGGVLAAL